MRMISGGMDASGRALEGMATVRRAELLSFRSDEK